jgi:hypothetical protein
MLVSTIKYKSHIIMSIVVWKIYKYLLKGVMMSGELKILQEALLVEGSEIDKLIGGQKISLVNNTDRKCSIKFGGTGDKKKPYLYRYMIKRNDRSWVSMPREYLTKSQAKTKLKDLLDDGMEIVE